MSERNLPVNTNAIKSGQDVYLVKVVDKVAGTVTNFETIASNAEEAKLKWIFDNSSEFQTKGYDKFIFDVKKTLSLVLPKQD